MILSVYPTGQAGASGAANIIAYNNLYYAVVQHWHRPVDAIGPINTGSTATPSRLLRSSLAGLERRWPLSSPTALIPTWWF